MEHGPVDVMALAFPVTVAADRVAATVRQPVEDGHVKLVDLVFLLRDGDGTLVAYDAEDPTFTLPGLAGVRIEPHTLLSDDDLEMLADSLGPEENGVAIVYENTWAAETGRKLGALGAEVALLARIPADEVDAAYAAEDAG